MTNRYSGGSLMGNWFEERSPGLRGVVADYGDEVGRFRTTHLSGFPDRARDEVPTTRSWALLAEATKKSAWSLTQKEGSVLATAAAKTKVDPTGFSKARAKKIPEKDSFATSYNLAFGPRTSKPDYTFDAPAIGRSGMREERGMRTSGMTGEVFKNESDPQHNTAMQRAWLPTSTLIDHVIKTKEEQAHKHHS